eukprot:g25057.t1
MVQNQKLRVLIYNGDADPGLNSFYAQNWTTAVGIPEVQSWRPWTRDGKMKMGGYATRYEHDFDFLTIRGAGHMVPEFKPEAAFVMMSSFLSGQDYPPYNPPKDKVRRQRTGSLKIPWVATGKWCNTTQLGEALNLLGSHSAPVVFQGFLKVVKALENVVEGDWEDCLDDICQWENRLALEEDEGGTEALDSIPFSWQFFRWCQIDSGFVQAKQCSDLAGARKLYSYFSFMLVSGAATDADLLAINEDDTENVKRGGQCSRWADVYVAVALIRCLQ